MNLLSNGKHEQGSGKIITSKAVEDQGENNDGADDDSPCKICKTSYVITNLPVDCLALIFWFLETREDRNSFGLTCRQWLHIQNNNHLFLWFRYRHWPHDKYPRISPERFPKLLCKLLVRFQNLKYLSLTRCSKITDFDKSMPRFFESKVQYLCLDRCSEYSNTELSLMFSWFPRLTDVSLESTHITDKGLESLANCCSSLKEVNLSRCRWITDSGISFLVQNCRKLSSVHVNFCSRITGIGFLGCAQTLTDLAAVGCKLKPQGINAIASGGGIEYLLLGTTLGKARYLNTEAIMKISKGCPMLKYLCISDWEVELEGWEAIGQNCKNLEHLTVYGCRKLCDLGLQALCNGCNKLSRLYVDDGNSCSSYALELFKRNKPDVLCHLSYYSAAEAVMSDAEKVDKIDEFLRMPF
ncbi:hypothetical protein MKW92_017672 [Papaver armeniacum]|nr:hypothetical protein MKW92_017672 [Papaver armeniacum]